MNDERMMIRGAPILVKPLVDEMKSRGYLDQLLERAWLDGYAAAKHDASETEKRGGKYETECPFAPGKAASDGDLP